ncbi:MAG: Rrf2 family transcriptional regulator [Oscillospiraceae bacterium]|nr:Rrf2 family transcriptional regulator [Oscillospiraceae bacterium]MDD7429665.1 Rrf2 family transcriptional regulator [Oscillospiraceae bacterium]MDY2847508.1 Rrf2 family transcriptional regulator [Oscillospiraceae bacterium]
MRISTKVECGIIALIDIAINSADGEIVTVSSIAERHNISVKYLEQILPLLRQANLIRSQKGSRGGYVISSSGRDITFKDILNALDINILSDVTFDLPEKNNGYVDAINGFLWKDMTEYMKKYAEKITLADAVTRCRDAAPSDADEFMYYI